ncbi:MAG: hypothetical protein Q9175_001511 [Cornicularia normoerica]
MVPSISKEAFCVESASATAPAQPADWMYGWGVYKYGQIGVNERDGEDFANILHPQSVYGLDGHCGSSASLEIGEVGAGEDSSRESPRRAALSKGWWQNEDESVLGQIFAASSQKCRYIETWIRNRLEPEEKMVIVTDFPYITEPIHFTFFSGPPPRLLHLPLLWQRCWCSRFDAGPDVRKEADADLQIPDIAKVIEAASQLLTLRRQSAEEIADDEIGQPTVSNQDLQVGTKRVDRVLSAQQRVDNRIVMVEVTPGQPPGYLQKYRPQFLAGSTQSLRFGPGKDLGDAEKAKVEEWESLMELKLSEWPEDNTEAEDGRQTIAENRQAWQKNADKMKTRNRTCQHTSAIPGR